MNCRSFLIACLGTLLVAGCGKLASNESSSTNVSEKWSSGGGELIGDKQNPWFLQNTKRVTYCIVKDISSFGDLPPSFGNKPTTVERLVRESLEYWKQSFKAAEPFTPPYFEAKIIRIATQEFVEEACSPTTDLRFQFGVLDGEQFKYLGNPRARLGIAVRTQYDRVNLVARGFLYFSPDRGPLAYEGPGTVPGAWHLGEAGRLKRVIIHELGHVFGLQHKSDGLMSERYIDHLAKSDVLFDSEHNAVPTFAFQFDDSKASGTFLAKPTLLHSLLEMPDTWTELRVQVSLSKQELSIGGAPRPGTPFTDLGKAKFTLSDWKTCKRFHLPEVIVYLNDEQTVFPKVETVSSFYPTERVYRDKLEGPGLTNFALSAPLVLSSGKMKSVTLRLSIFRPFSANIWTLGGVVDDKYYFDLNTVR